MKSEQNVEEGDGIPRNELLILMLLLAIPVGAAAKNKDNGRPPCATTYSVIQEDKLGNVQQGISKSKDLKWTDQDLEKKYPDVCYAAPDPSVKTVFVITVAPATYNGTKVVTEYGHNTQHQEQLLIRTEKRYSYLPRDTNQPQLRRQFPTALSTASLC